MNELKVFENAELGKVRVVFIDNEPWWVAKDVADVLGYKWQANIIAHIPQHWKGVSPINTLGGTQNMAILSEQGLYFFLSRSDKQKALPFQMWIAGEVVPSIRQTGGYGMYKLPQNYIEALEALVVSEKEKQRLVIENIEMKPKAEFYDAVTDSTDAIDMGYAAKVLNMGVGRNTLFKILRDNKILMHDNIPYQEFIDRGYFRTIEQKYTTSDGSTQISIKTVVYQKGLDFIRKLLVKTRGYENESDMYICGSESPLPSNFSNFFD